MAGSYTVNLTVTDRSNAQTSRVYTIIVALPNATPAAAPTGVPLGMTPATAPTPLPQPGRHP